MNEKKRIGASAKSNIPRPSRAVIILYSAMVTLALSIAIVNFISDYERTKEDLEVRAEAYAISMATDVRWYVEVARQTLRRTADRISQSASLNDIISDASNDLPEGVIVAIYDENGTSQRVYGHQTPDLNISDRHYFQSLKAGKDWVISNLIDDRLTKTKTFAVGLALQRDGVFKGAAVAYAPMDVFKDAWMSFGGSKANVFLVHRDGWLTARLPTVDSYVYDTKLSEEFVGLFTKAPTGSFWADASPIDGVSRVLGYAEVPSTPLIAVLGQSPEDEFKKLWRRIGVSLAILAPILILLGYATLKVRDLLARQEVTEKRLRSALETNERFLLEIHHRVKNNLQSAQSLIRMYVKSPEIMAQIEPRIAAMAKVHEHIYRSDHLVAIRAEEYLKDIAQQIIFSSSKEITLHTEIDPIELPSDVAMPVGQLLNEAVINAVKYGYPDRDDGQILITMKMTDENEAILTIHNDGDPMPIEDRKGIGSRLMPAFASQVHGTVETTSNDEGVTVTLRFPLTGKRA